MLNGTQKSHPRPFNPLPDPKMPSIHFLVFALSPSISIVRLVSFVSDTAKRAKQPPPHDIAYDAASCHDQQGLAPFMIAFFTQSQLSHFTPTRRSLLGRALIDWVISTQFYRGTQNRS
ncbi:uncharacterized protein LY89DRAFT_51268 [Mollisia scopiformis]|uniref:Uncharacterized protein n=1 Tax=Mollisia scopiformis TaxID=149040 RepID=A0A194XB13_MOLSC|nr:uncharacterized protein LY89DRAFT_51268 [Mollisia scopiformis]KUJ17334.1 hypothetical protein LY89DRAFT_51268 [Mollisia scopiformis]